MKNILIIGAGKGGKEILKSFRKGNDFSILGFLDDSSNLKNKIIDGVKVLGNVLALKKLQKIYIIDEVIIAIPSLEGEKLKVILKIVEESKLNYRFVPGFYNYSTNDVEIKYPLRKIDITDLLGRHTVDLPHNVISKFVKNKTILVTGAGGSIGSEICRTVMMFNPKKIILLGRGEGSIFEIHSDLKLAGFTDKVVIEIANITDRELIIDIVNKYKPEVIFHAAAHKHVGYMEMAPKEAFKNNVIGTINVCDAAISSKKTKTVVFLSTDKAVKPISVMGMTKRIGERLIQNDYRNSNVNFCAVRFGNVLGSRGSVIKIFQSQIEKGHPITISHKKVKRFFMTIPEASQLVLMAGAIANKGSVFVLDTGKEISILQLAKDLIVLHGYKPYEEVSIKFTNLLQGEKLRESPLIGKKHIRTSHNKIWEELPEKNITYIKEELLRINRNMRYMSEENLLKEFKKLSNK